MTNWSRPGSVTNCRKSSNEGYERRQQTAGCLQLYADQKVGCEAALHALHKIFESNETEAILKVDTEDAFNSINRKTLT